MRGMVRLGALRQARLERAAPSCSAGARRWKRGGCPGARGAGRGVRGAGRAGGGAGWEVWRGVRGRGGRAGAGRTCLWLLAGSGARTLRP